MVTEAERFVKDFEIIKGCVDNGIYDVERFQNVFRIRDDSNDDWSRLEQIRQYFNAIQSAIYRIELSIEQKPLF